jgi:preprotein translocase subunit SecY
MVFRSLIFGGIAAGLPSAIGGLLELVRTGAMSIIVALFIVVLVGLVTYFVVFVERGQRKILVNYARRQVGNKVYGGQSSHLPLKLNMAGVIPPIFASSIILLPATLWVGSVRGESMRWLKDIAGSLTPRSTGLCDVVCGGYCIFLLLLHGTGFQ